MQEAEQAAKPPAGDADAVEEEKVQERKQPAADHVGDEADERGTIAMRRQHGADEKRQAESGQTEPLTALQDRRHRHGGDEPPQGELWQLVNEVGDHAQTLCWSASAALMMPTCV